MVNAVDGKQLRRKDGAIRLVSAWASAIGVNSNEIPAIPELLTLSGCVTNAMGCQIAMALLAVESESRSTAKNCCLAFES